MSGHSKWSTIKHKKGILDQRRGTLFTKLTREITVAARSGDIDPEHNFRLRLAVENARSQNMPKGNIERAMQRAKGVSGEANLQEVTYEAYGPGGSGLIVQTLTDNKNRAFSAVRTVVSRNGATMAGAGSVAWNFTLKGHLLVAVESDKAEAVALRIVDAGAEDVDLNESTISVTVAYGDFATVREKIGAVEGVEIESAELVMEPNSTVELDEQKSRQMMRLIEALEELDDVQKVFSNADFPESLLAELSLSV